MYRSVRWLALLLVVAGCRDTRSASDRARMTDVATGTGSARPQDQEAGVEFDAPRLIPGIRAQISEIEGPAKADTVNLTAFRNGVGALVNAMKADLNRVGVSDSGYFYVLSDSVLRGIAGGAGDVAQVERLITIYEERMRRAVN